MHQIHQLFGNGKTKSGAFDISVILLINSLERLKQLFLIFFCNSNSRIDNLNFQKHLLFFDTFPIDAKCDTSLLGVFHCISQKICNNLSNPHLISIQMGWNLWIIFKMNLQSFFLCTGLNNIIAVIDDGCQFILYRDKLHFSRLYF